jgi:hypothetical protein
MLGSVNAASRRSTQDPSPPKLLGHKSKQVFAAAQKTKSPPFSAGSDDNPEG